VAVLVSVVTDNRNRTVAEVRHVLSRSGGNMAEAGSVSWQFKRVAFFGFDLGKNDPDKIFELAVEAGADDVNFDDNWVEIVGPVESFKEISDALKAAHINPEDAELRFVPNMETELSDSDTIQVYKVLEALEDLDDVQDVYSTLAISDSAMAQLEAA
jgi:transcriptional/translational regulatory protein YebC/TACO1